MKRHLLALAIVLIFLCLSVKNFAQTAPNISYSPNTYTFPSGTNISPITPTNTGGLVAAFGFGTGTQVASGLEHPWGLGMDPSGNIYVANYGSTAHIPGLVTKYNPASNTMTTFVDGNTNTNISNPQGIAFDQAGNAYILNYNRTNNGNGNFNGNANVTVFNSAGTYVSTVISGLGAASGITNDFSSDIYIANAGNTTVSQYNSAGVQAFSVNGIALPDPVGVAIDNSGYIYVVDNSTKSVYKFSPTGAYISTLVTGLTNPFGVAIDGGGNIYVGDSGAGADVGTPTAGAGKVSVYSASGSFLTNLAGTYKDPRGFVVDQVGNLYVSDYSNNTLTQYPATGGYHLNGILPPGLSFNTTTGEITGTPTGAFGPVTYQVTAYNAAGKSNTTTITIQCTATLTITYSPNDINVFTQSTTNNITSLVPTITGSPTNFSISPNLTTATGLNFDTSTGTISGKPSVLSAAQVYTVTCTNGTNTATTTLSIACVVDDFWTGKNSSAWSDGGNWSTGTVPTGSTVLASIGVHAYNKKNSPEPIVSATASVYFLEFGAAHAATLTVNSGATLTINSSLTIDNNATPIVTGQGGINIAPSASVDITGTGILTINSPLNFTLQSNATNSAAVGPITTGGIIGQVAVERYLQVDGSSGSGYRGYRLGSSPVYAATVAVGATNVNVYSINYLKNSMFVKGISLATGGFDVSVSYPNNPGIFVYREDQVPSNATFVSGNWWGINGLNTSPSYPVIGGQPATSNPYYLPVGGGIMYYFRGNRAAAGIEIESGPTYIAQTATTTTTGTLNQGQVIVRDWYTPASANLGYTTGNNAAVRGSNLVGNPYASTIDWETFNITNNTSGIYGSNISNLIYERNPKTQNYNTYQQGGATTGNASRYIVSGQGFFVVATAANPQLIFNESCKLPTAQNTGTTLFMATKGNMAVLNSAGTAAPSHLRLQMALDSINTDDIYIGFRPDASAKYVLNEDAPYMSGDGKVSLSSYSSDNTRLAINWVPLTGKKVSIPMYATAQTYGNYTLNVTELAGIPQLYQVLLADAFKHDTVDLRQNPSYSLSLTKDTGSYSKHRFTLVIRQDPALAYQLLSFNADKGQNGRQAVITWVAKNEGNYTHFTVERSTDNGKTFDVVGGFTSTGAGSYSLADMEPLKGDNLYRLKSVDYNDSTSYSKVVDLLFNGQGGSNDNSNITLYPNPVNNVINVDIAPTDKKNNTAYDIRIINSFGLIIRQGTTKDTSWQTNVGNILPGTYIVEVTSNKDHSLVGRSKFVKN
ncbi:T9SS type A sorting domain-containing protein [Mucilaginibacter sp. McL0603]|uniref:T9SS type A sorting domain-containing protein n=1 Tax=Mucilaginibacter sp. McL0603 TaxID=3415670 RepID=UPI003CF735A4